MLVELDEGEPEVYALPLSVRTETEADQDAAVLLKVIDRDQNRWVIVDGLTDESFARQLLQIALEGKELSTPDLRLAGRLIHADATPLPDLENLPEKLPKAEQSNSNVIFGDQLILKIYRKLGEGINPELEIGEHLTAKAQFSHIAPLVAAIELSGIGGGSTSRTLAVVMSFVPNQGDAWQAFLDHAHRYFEALAALTAEQLSTLCTPGGTGCARWRSAARRSDVDRFSAGIISSAGAADG